MLVSYLFYQYFIKGQMPLPNPHGDPVSAKPLMTLQKPVEDILYGRNVYVKKIIEEANTVDETAKLLKVRFSYC